MKRGRHKVSKPRFFVASRSDPEDEERVRRKAESLGSVVDKMTRRKAGEQYFVGSYNEEWSDEELDLAQQKGFEFVTEEFLEHFGQMTMNDVLALPGRIDHAVWDERELETDPESEMPFPQTCAEFLAMPDRLAFGADGNKFMLVNMSRDESTKQLLTQVREWFEAFFGAETLILSGPLLVASKGRKRTSYEAFLEKLWSEKEEHEEVYAMVGITDLDICDVEAEEATIYGRATGDGAGIISSFHFKKEKLRPFLSTAAHETLHVFGIDHCAQWQCLMNDSCDVDVPESIHMFLCPCCLAKLKSCVAFDDEKRYQALATVAKKLGLEGDAQIATNLMKSARRICL